MSMPALRFKNDIGQDYPDWEDKTLEQLASVERGKFSVRPRNDPKYFGGKIPFVQTGDVVFAGLFLTRFSQTLNDEGLKVSRLFPKNTVLITIAANIGDTTITKFDVACTDSVVAIQPFNYKANHVWLKFSLDTKKDELDSKATQNAQKNINLQILKPLLFNTPTFQEQTKIANFLTSVDEKITHLTQKHDLLTQYKKGVMQQIFSQELRFKDDDGQDFPEWGIESISEVIHNYGGTALEKYVCTDGTHNFISIGNYEKNGRYFDNGQRLILNEKTKQKLLNKGDLVMVLNDKTLAGDLIGSTLLISEDNKFIYNQRSERLVCKVSIVEPKFIWHLFNSIKFRKEVFLISQGGTQIYVNFPAVKKLKIPVPSLQEQNKIANFLSAIDDKITATQTQLKAVKQYKQGLLQQMFVKVRMS